MYCGAPTNGRASPRPGGTRLPCHGTAYKDSIGKWSLAHGMAIAWANVSQQWLVTSQCSNCCRPTVVSAMLANNLCTESVHRRVLQILSWLNPCALGEHSVIRTKNFSSRVCPISTTICSRPAASQSEPAPQMRIPATRAGWPAFAQDSNGCMRTNQGSLRAVVMDYLKDPGLCRIPCYTLLH